MIETQTLIGWARELCDFVNMPPRLTYRDTDVTEAFFGTEGFGSSTPGDSEVAALHAKAKQALTELAKWKVSAPGGVPAKLLQLAEGWLMHPLVRGEPMNGGELSLSEGGYLQVIPRFVNRDAQFAATFAELITPPGKKRLLRKLPMIRRCDWCEAFFVYLPKQAAPRILCDPHYEETKRTKKRPKVRKPTK